MQLNRSIVSASVHCTFRCLGGLGREGREGGREGGSNELEERRTEGGREGLEAFIILKAQHASHDFIWFAPSGND